VQFYQEDNQIFFEVNDAILSDEELSLYASKIQMSLDISHGPIDKLIWFEGRGLLWIIHHLVIDGVSWRILLEDLNNTYNGIELPAKTHSLQDWGRYISNYSDFDSTLCYYVDLKPSNLINEYGYLKQFLKKHISITFSKEQTTKFVKEINKSYNTQSHEILILAVILAIGDIQGKYDFTVALEGHGREPLKSELDLSRTMGWFTSVYPVAFNVSSPENLDIAIKEIKEQLRKVPEKGVTYGISTLKNVINPLKADILFNYLGQWDNNSKQNNIFKFGSYPTGSTISEARAQIHTLEINSIIKDNVLTVNWLYTNCLNENNAKRMVARFKDRLNEIIQFCTQGKNYGFTPSDFEADQLSQEDLDNIISIINADYK
jgi:non-ribosomal peptide synthase protein (TIGR01720 family)